MAGEARQPERAGGHGVLREVDEPLAVGKRGAQVAGAAVAEFFVWDAVRGDSVLMQEVERAIGGAGVDGDDFGGGERLAAS